MKYKPSLERREHGWNDSKKAPVANYAVVIPLAPPHDEATLDRARDTIRRHARGADDFDMLTAALGLDGVR